MRIPAGGAGGGPGESQAVLYFEDCKKRVGTRCMIHPALVQDLKERLGEENVVVK